MTATTKTVKAPNFTAEQTATMVSAYVAEPTAVTVATLAEQLGKSVRSITMKLVREKVYIKKEYKTKTGEAVQAKAELANAIGAVLKLTENDVSSLESANKNALKVIFEALANSKPL